MSTKRFMGRRASPPGPKQHSQMGPSWAQLGPTGAHMECCLEVFNLTCHKYQYDFYILYMRRWRRIWAFIWNRKRIACDRGIQVLVSNGLTTGHRQILFYTNEGNIIMYLYIWSWSALLPTHVLIHFIRL